jgi:hypothetical protein
MTLVPHTSSGGLSGKSQNLITMILALQKQVAALQTQIAQCQGITFISPNGTEQPTLTSDNYGNLIWNGYPILQRGNVGVNFSGSSPIATASVTFETPYATAPTSVNATAETLQTGDNAPIIVQVYNITATGFDIQVWCPSGTPTSSQWVGVNWIAAL